MKSGFDGMVPEAEIKERIFRLQSRLLEEQIGGALFVYPIDVYYFTGSRQNGCLWVPAEGRPVLLVRKSYVRAMTESLNAAVRPFPPSSELLAFFGEKAGKIGLTFDVIPVHQYNFYAKLLRNKEFTDISAINRELRSVKSPWEVEQLRMSAKMLCEAFVQVPAILRPGMRELDLAAEFEYLMRKAGSDGYLRIRAFHQEIVGLAVAGENAALPGCFDGPVTGKGLSSATPYGPSRDLISENTPIMIDYGLICNGYIVDMTRIFVLGELDHDLKVAFDYSIAIQNWLVENIAPGSICEELFAGAASIAATAGLADKFMGYPGEQAKFVGHGVGLELDELPIIAQKFRSPLLPGQAIAIEPKFVFPDRGVVGIENTYVVTETGCEKLTDFPDRIVSI